MFKRKKPAGTQAKKKKPGDLTPKSTSTQSDEKQTAIQRFVAWLKRFIGYKKGERDEFRYNFDTEHPNYIFEEKDGKRRGFGITHEEYTHGKKNMPLNQNPEQGDTQKAYVRYGVIKGNKRSYGKRPIKKMSFGKQDNANVKSKKRNYKKRSRRNRKKNNKKGK